MSIPQPLPTRSAKLMKPPPTYRWLWQPYIPIGRLTLIDGAEGIGKGFFATQIAMRVVSEGGSVLWFTAEDDPEEDLQRRLLAAGWNPKLHGDVLFYDGMEEQDFFGVPADLRRLNAAIKQYAPAVVIMDPGRSFLKAPKGQQMSYNDDSLVRPGLQKLNQMAARAKVALPFIHHWKRDGSAAPSERFSGSGAFSQACRHRVTLARYGIEDDAEACYAVTKTNISTRGHLRHYRLEVVPELESARWEDAGANRQDRDLDTWWRRLDQQAKTVTLYDQTDDVIQWLVANCAVGNKIPSRGDLMTLTGVSERYVKSALHKARTLGWLTDGGRNGLLWQGSNHTNGASSKAVAG